RNGRQEHKPFRCDLPLAARLMDPDGALTIADRGDERSAVGIELDSLFFGHAKCDLFGRSIGIALPPDVRSAADIGREVHPLSSGRARGVSALSWRGTNQLTWRTAIERRHTARHPASFVHLDEQHVFSVGRDVRTVRHPGLAGGYVNGTMFVAALGRCRN